MYVNYSGWSKNQGSFSCDIFVDEKRHDYEIHYENGEVIKQCSSFHVERADWNHDGDVYEQYGAWFGKINSDGTFTGGSFWTPEDMVRAAVDALDKDAASFGPRIKCVTGIKIPPPEKRPSLDTKIRDNERRAMARDIDRNRKMQALGIRQPNEPWAR